MTVFITSIVVYLVTKKITQKVEPQIENGDVDAQDMEVSLEAGGTATGAELSTVKVTNDITRKPQLVDNDKPNFDGLIKICKNN